MLYSYIIVQQEPAIQSITTPIQLIDVGIFGGILIIVVLIGNFYDIVRWLRKRWED